MNHTTKSSTLIALAIAVVGCQTSAKAKLSFGAPPPAAPKVQAPTPKPKRFFLARLKQDRIEIDEKVHFKFDKAEIESVSNALLDDVVEVLKQHPQVHCEVAGHTDNVGTPDYNRKLSQERADAVKAYIVGKGIAADRLAAKGYGPDQAIADNTTDDGKEKNRRVEFRVVASVKATTK